MDASKSGAIPKKHSWDGSREDSIESSGMEAKTHLKQWGRFSLRFVVFAALICMMNSMSLPKIVYTKIDSILERFLMRKARGYLPLYLKPWDSLWKPKSIIRMGFRRMGDMNKALMANREGKGRLFSNKEVCQP